MPMATSEFPYMNFMRGAYCALADPDRIDRRAKIPWTHSWLSWPLLLVIRASGETCYRTRCAEKSIYWAMEGINPKNSGLVKSRRYHGSNLQCAICQACWLNIETCHAHDPGMRMALGCKFTWPLLWSSVGISNLLAYRMRP